MQASVTGVFATFALVAGVIWAWGELGAGAPMERTAYR
jgi:hypothetical protein